MKTTINQHRWTERIQNEGKKDNDVHKKKPWIDEGMTRDGEKPVHMPTNPNRYYGLGNCLFFELSCAAL